VASSVYTSHRQSIFSNQCACLMEYIYVRANHR
jgi:hypothetical protein